MKKKQSIGSQLVAMRYAKMTAAERKEAAKRALQARWAYWRAAHGKPPKPGDEDFVKVAAKKAGKKKRA